MNDPTPPPDRPLARTPAHGIGAAADRLEDDRLLKGRGCFVDDRPLPGALHLVVLRSPVAHARLRRIDAAPARARPGVRAVLTAEDIASRCGGEVPRIPMVLDPLPEAAACLQPVMAASTLRYVGEPLAVVLADTAALAEDALDHIDLEFDTLDCVVEAGLDAVDPAVDVPDAQTLEAVPPGRPVRVTRLRAVRGSADACLGAAPLVKRARLRMHRHFASPLETRGLLAHFDAARSRLTVWGAAKMPFANRRILAGQLGMAEADIDLVEGDTGGAFGLRGEFYPEDFLVPYAALWCGQPVRWVEDRREHLVAGNHAREAECELEIAYTAEGRLLGLRGRVAVDIGAYMRTTGLAQARNVIQVAPGPYRIEHVDLTCDVLLSNKTPSGPYRGPGRFEADFFRERVLDLIAEDLGLDRAQVRARNLLRACDMPWSLPTVFPHGSRTATDSGDCTETLARCLAEFDWTRRSTLSGRRIEGRLHGIGVGCYLEGGGSGPSETARLVLEQDGRIAIHTGSSLVGQGLETALAQIAADTLGLPLRVFHMPSHGSTTGVPDGFGSYSSRSVVMGGSAVRQAAQLLGAQLRAAAAAVMGCAPSAVRFGIEEPAARSDDGSIGLAALARACAARPLEALARFSCDRRTYSYGAHAAHVAVDPDTGVVEVLEYVAVEDVGRIINPRTLHGQAIGAITQGLGGVFLEHLVYDSQGQLLTGSLADYLLPSACCFPKIRAILLENHPSPLNPLGAKGAGEGGIIPVGGVVANAIADALRPLGVCPLSLPLPPSRLWQMIASSTCPGTRFDAPPRTACGGQ
ncbi:MAG: xanthine dehydrogenase family protein molybdopterin-binding subunit [Pseudomonadota bacterium]